MRVFKIRPILAATVFFALMSFQKEEVDSTDFDKFCTEMRSFIVLSKSEAIQNGKYNVYLAKFMNETGAESCVTMEYILSNNQYLHYVTELEKFHHFVIIDSSLVLMSFEGNFQEKYDFNDRRISRLDDASIITTRLSKEIFFGDGSVSVSCFKGDDISKEIYQNESYVPDNKRIFNYESKGVIRKVDSAEFKSKQRKKKN
jgi:hypothetical protein